MAVAGFNARFELFDSVPNGSDYDIQANISDYSGTYSGYDVQVGDIIILDIGSYPIDNAKIASYEVLNIISIDVVTVALTIKIVDTWVSDIPDPSYYIGQPGFIGRDSDNLKLLWSISDDVQQVPRYMVTEALNLEKFNKMDNPPSGGGSAFTSWESGKSYLLGDTVSYRGIVFKAKNNHTAGTTFSDDLVWWDALDNTAAIKYKVSHGVAPLSPVYVTPTSFYPAQADTETTLGTHIVMDVALNHALLVNSGDYYYPAHGLTGVCYVDPLTPGVVTNTSPDPSQYYINPVMVIDGPDWISVVANQPAYKK